MSLPVEEKPAAPALERSVINQFHASPEIRVFCDLLDRYDIETGEDLADPDDCDEMEWQSSPYASRIDQLSDSLADPQDPAQVALLQEIISVATEAGAQSWLTDAAKVATLQDVSGKFGIWVQEKEEEIGAPQPFADISSKTPLVGAGFMHFAKYSHSDRARVESISHSLELPEKCAIGKLQTFNAPSLISDGGQAVDEYYKLATTKIIKASFENVKSSWQVFNGQDTSVYSQLSAEHPEIERHELKLDVKTFAPAKCDQKTEMTFVLLKWQIGAEVHKVVLTEDCPWTSIGSYKRRDVLVGSDIQAAARLDFTHELMSEFCQLASGNRNIFADAVTPNIMEMHSLIERIHFYQANEPTMSWEAFEEMEGVTRAAQLDLLIKKASDYFPFAPHLIDTDQQSDDLPIKLGQFSIDLLAMMHQRTTSVPIFLSRDSPCIALSVMGFPAQQSLLSANEQRRKEDRESKSTAFAVPGNLETS